MKFSICALFLTALPLAAHAASETGAAETLAPSTAPKEEMVEINLDVGLTLDEMEALFLDDMEAGTIEGGQDLNGDGAGSGDDAGGSGGLRGRKLQSSSLTLLCKHSDCQGGRVWANPGSYSSMPWQIGNDELTRVYIPPGHTFTYYQHGNFQGWQRTFGEPNRWVNLFMGGHNDAVSSFIIRRF